MADRQGNIATVEGAAANDATAVQNPVLIGGRASANEPTEVSADGDAVSLWSDRKGRVVVALDHPSPNSPSTVTLTDTTETALVASPGAGQRTYVYNLVASNTSSTGVRLDIKEGSTVRFSFFLAASGGGFVLPMPVPWRLPLNTALNVQLSASVTDVRVSALTSTAP